MEDRIDRVVERMGMLFDAKHFSRTSGRIFGFLLFAERPRPIEEIAVELALSRASVSTEARRLESVGLLERTGRPGDRRDYYGVSPSGFRRMMQSQLARMGEMHELFKEALDIPQMNGAVSERVRSFCDVHHFMQTKLSELLEQWKAHAAAPASQSKTP